MQDWTRALPAFSRLGFLFFRCGWAIVAIDELLGLDLDMYLAKVRH